MARLAIGWGILVGGLLAGALTVPAIAQDPTAEAYARILGNSEDRIVLTISMRREGADDTRADDAVGSSFDFNEGHNAWQRDESSGIFSLVSFGRWSDSSVRFDLAMWQARLDELRAQREEWLKFPDRDSARLVADPAIGIAHDAAASRIEDVELLLRLLMGIEIYQTLVESYPDRVGPISDLPRFTGGGGTSRYYGTEMFDDGTAYPFDQSTSMLPYTINPAGWDFDDNRALAEALGMEAGEAAWPLHAARNVSIVLWRFDPNDMTRANELISAADEFSRELHYEPVNVDADLVTYAEIAAENYNLQFETVFIRALRELVRCAWHLSPSQPPAGFWTDTDPITEQVNIDIPYVAENAPLGLPDLPGDQLALLRMPAHGFPADQPFGELPDDAYWGAKFAADTWVYRAARHAVVSAPDRESHRFLSEEIDPGGDSEVRIAGSGNLDGSVTIKYEFSETGLANNGDLEVFNTGTETIVVTYSIAPEDGVREDFSIPMTLSLSHPVDNKIVPLAEPLHYGDAFYVEARLEQPATRQAYSVTLSFGDVEETILLRPVEDDDRQLRSDMHYLIWDVPAERADVTFPEGYQQ
ncbi:MAG: hypothetical protein WD711_11970 [Dongiaceae bacterium]